LHLLSQFLLFLRFKSEFQKSDIASKFHLGLLNAYKLMYFLGNIIKVWEAINEYIHVTSEEFPFDYLPES
jgi:hypothetical protein